MEIERIRKLIESRTPRLIDINNEYSVLIPIVERNNRLEIIFELRSKNMNSQPGEISFPGGRVEGNESFKDAAIRETMEELNIKKDNINIIGELDYLVSYANIIIRCFVGTISEIEDIVPNPDEVDHIFTIPLDFFLEMEPDTYYLKLQTALNNEFPYDLIPNGRQYNWRTGKHTVMFYKYKDYVIWGLTAKLMKNFVDILL